MIPPETKILNIDAKLRNGSTLKLQAAGKQEIMHNAICNYLKRTLNDESISTFQKAINAKACEQTELKNFQFNSDQRIYELMVGETIYAIVQKSKSPDASVRFSWQRGNQQKLIQEITKSNSGSIDGALSIFIKGKEGITALPIEAKSTMIKPGCVMTDDICTQALNCIDAKEEDLAAPAQLSAILILPYSDTDNLKIDLQPIANKLEKIIAQDSMAAICLLSSHETEIRITGCVIYGKGFQLNLSNIKTCMGVLKYIYK